VFPEGKSARAALAFCGVSARGVFMDCPAGPSAFFLNDLCFRGFESATCGAALPIMRIEAGSDFVYQLLTSWMQAGACPIH
jgi:hypothetical protein